MELTERILGRASSVGQDSGQMTVELAVMAPVILAVAVVAVNASLFFSECAAFDRLSLDAIRAEASSLPFGGREQDACVAIREELDRNFDDEFLSVEVASENVEGGLVEYTATLRFRPTLFGLGFKSEIFGVSLPALFHESSLTVNPYRPGVLL